MQVSNLLVQNMTVCKLITRRWRQSMTLCTMSQPIWCRCSKTIWYLMTSTSFWKGRIRMKSKRWGCRSSANFMSRYLRKWCQITSGWCRKLSFCLRIWRENKGYWMNSSNGSIIWWRNRRLKLELTAAALSSTQYMKNRRPKCLTPNS